MHGGPQEGTAELGPQGVELLELGDHLATRLRVALAQQWHDELLVETDLALDGSPPGAQVASVGVSEDGELSMVVDGGVEVRYGSVGDGAAKAQALRAILSFAAREGKVLLAVDVSAPGAPTARFVGSYQPPTGPDPSADVPEPSADDRGTGATRSPSASASSTP